MISVVKRYTGFETGKGFYDLLKEEKENWNREALQERLKELDEDIDYIKGIIRTLKERFEGAMSDCVVCHTYWEESEDLQDQLKQKLAHKIKQKEELKGALE